MLRRVSVACIIWHFALPIQSENQAGPDVPQPVDGPDVQPPAEAGLAYEQRGKPQPVHSFSGPFVTENGAFTVPHFSTKGSAVVEEQSVRLTGPEPKLRGGVWNNEPLFSINWEVNVEFRATGGRYMGGDGSAFWYTAKPMDAGDMFGSDEKFKGLVVYFDSYDNDGARDNPVVSAMVSDGKKLFDHETDGRYTRLEGASCKTNYRNTRLPTVAKIVYENATLSVLMDTKGTGQFLTCFVVEDVHLLKGGYIGLTAGTGDVADTHDVFAMNTFSLDAHDLHEQLANKVAELTDSSRPFLKRPAHSLWRFLRLNEHDRQHYFAVRRQTGLHGAKGRQQKTKARADGASGDDGGMGKAVHEQLMTELAYLSERVKKIQATVDEYAAAADPPAQDAAPAPSASADGTAGLGDLVAAIKGIRGEIEMNLQSVVQKQQEEMAALKKDVLELRDLLHQASAAPRVEEDLVHKLGTLTNDVVKLKSTLDTTHMHHKSVASEVKDHIVTLHSTIQQSSSTFGFWTYFAFFQVMFVVGFFYWRRMQEQSRKLL